MLVPEVTTSWQRFEAQRQVIEAALTDTFVRHAIDNRGVLMSPRRGTAVAETLFNLAGHYLSGQLGEAELASQASELAEQGMVLTTASAMLRALHTAVPAEIRQEPRLGEFELLFLEKLSAAREIWQQRAQERAQTALQRALHQQLEQQIVSHEVQKRQNETLNRILQLTAQLSQVLDEQALFAAATRGFSEALGVANVALYAYEAHASRWHRRADMMAPGQDAGIADPDQADQADLSQLQLALEKGGEAVRVYRLPDGQDGLAIATVLQAGPHLLGGLVVQHDHMTGQDSQPFLLMVRTFAQNLAALWHSLLLNLETDQRARELEILHGRYLDSIWNTEHAALQAHFADGRLHISRDTSATDVEPAYAHVPLTVGDYPFGQIHLLDGISLSPEDEEFVDVLAREMGSALNNAHFLQTARSYSNQLSVAAEVSRAATTILDRDMLIEEMVELIRTRFNFYYVGLFLLDDEEKEAVLQAGTGEAGAKMTAEGYSLVIGGKSMIGTAVATDQARVEQDVSQARAFRRNPNLPLTRAELALPLRARGRTIGALTVQSKETGAFSQEGVTVLQSLADQLAVAIENAELFAQTEKNLAQSNRLYETSRRINEATEPEEVYQALVDFASDSNLVDLAQLFVAEPASPDYLVSPVFWSNLGIVHDRQHRFSRDKFQIANTLETAEVIRIIDGQNDDALDEYTRTLFTNNGVRAATIVPIFAEQRWLGSLVLNRVAPTPLTDQELQPFITLTDQAAIILANHQLLQQTETLYQIGRLLNQSITRDDALDIAVQEVAKYVGAVQCRMVLYDDKAGYVAAEYGAYENTGAIQLPVRDDFVFEQLRQRGGPLLLAEDDPTISKEVIARHVLPFAAKASLLLPAANQQELMGFLAIDSRRGTRPFTATNIIFAQTVVDQLVTQLENLKLLDEALQRAQELITLNQIQSNVSHYLELDELSHAVYQQVGRLLDNTIFTLARYEAETNHYQLVLRIVEGIEVKQDGRVLAPGEPLHTFLQQNSHWLLDDVDPLTLDEAFYLPQAPQAGLWLPMLREDKTVGLMSVQSYTPHAYNENDVQLLRSIATQSNLAMANAELFARVQAHNEELMQLDQLKTQFLANMSHELRTPLNSIIGFSRVILKGIDGPITAEQEEDLTSIYQNGQHLLNLINEILDMAKIEAGKMTLSFEEVDLLQAAQAVHGTVRGLVDLDKVELLWQMPPDLPSIEGDPIRIRQILLNLLSNAAKYTAEGCIQLQMAQEDAHIHIVVKDSGIGIAGEDFHKIFAAFEQADSSTTRAVSGTGLGLPITKWLVEMHQGRIYVESELNKGSAFHVILPIQRKQEEMAEG